MRTDHPEREDFTGCTVTIDPQKRTEEALEFYQIVIELLQARDATIVRQGTPDLFSVFDLEVESSQVSLDAQMLAGSRRDNRDLSVPRQEDMTLTLYALAKEYVKALASLLLPLEKAVTKTE